MRVTYNKDGSPRKRGSGRPRGASSFTGITKQYLLHIAEDQEVIPVSRLWLEKKMSPSLPDADKMKPSV